MFELFFKAREKYKEARYRLDTTPCESVEEKRELKEQYKRAKAIYGYAIRQLIKDLEKIQAKEGLE